MKDAVEPFMPSSSLSPFVNEFSRVAVGNMAIVVVIVVR
jgi:hypothetical protein